jgi:hypothetical protein
LKGLKEAISKDKKELISEESAKLLGRIGSVGKLLE